MIRTVKEIISTKKMNAIKYTLFISLLVVTTSILAKPRPKPLVYIGSNGKLEYISDEKGNRIIDFSYCGYEASEKEIPLVHADVLIPNIEGDATEIIQKAIDYVGNLPMDDNGFRGAVQFEAGKYLVKGRLIIKKSGIVLRGKGMGDNGTQLIAGGKDRLTFIRVLGEDNKILGNASDIKDAYVPVNAIYITVKNSVDFTVGQKIMIHRPSTKKWIDELKMREVGGESTGYVGWKPGQRDIWWDRTITEMNSDTLFFNAPITTALDTTYGISQVVPYEWKGRISNIGIENLSLTSEYDASNPKDEDHCHSAISIENAENVWVRQIVFTHFAGSAVAAYETARKVTVEDCVSLAPVSEIGGWRRNTFFTMGQQTLFQRLYAEDGYHDFATGFCATGPNAFVECYSSLPHNFSGAIDSWASGLLFDIVNVDGQRLSFNNHYLDNQGSGWCAANSMFYQCSADRIESFAPPTATNWCIASWAQFIGDGYWHEQNSHLSPRSLYYKQLADRLGKDEKDFENQYRPKPNEATSSPTAESATELSKEAHYPLETMKSWVMRAPERVKIKTDSKDALLATKIKEPKKQKEEKTPEVSIKNGWMVYGSKVMAGMRFTVPWWRGVARPYQAVKENPCITRYVPGRYGHGYTDDLAYASEWMKEHNMVGIEHNYGLWYDRRRMDHERVRRMNGNVWAPFFVQPWGRSGQGISWDGLSKYDLTKFDYFYWSRLKQFADIAAKEGQVLVHHNYFQHNILEAGAHWSDSPWRPVNNINNTGFPEPAPYAGDKRIFVAEQFYDINHPVRRELHEKFIRQCLDNFEDNNNVLQLISAEYTGPTEFVEFWIDVIKEWEKETGKSELICLSTTKDVQDEILNQPERASVIDVIDIRYWSYRPDSSAYAPKGGVNLAPRQHARLEKKGKRSFNSIYRNVIEYKMRFPDKAVIFSEGRFNVYGWAVLMAGGSLPVLPQEVSKDLLISASSMKPVENAKNAEDLSMLSNNKGEYIIHLSAKNNVDLDLSSYRGTYVVRYVDLNTGKITGAKKMIKAGSKVSLSNPYDSNSILWITKK